MKEENGENFPLKQRDSLIHMDSRRRTDKSMQVMNTPFHHDNMKLFVTSTCQQILNPCFQSAPTYSRFLSYGPSPTGVVVMDPYCMNPQITSTPLPTGMCETMYQTDGQNATNNHSSIISNHFNITNINQVDNQTCNFKPQNYGYRYIKSGSSVQQLQKYISHWKKFKLPPCKEEVSHPESLNNHCSKPSIVPDNLDCLNGMSLNAVRLLKHLRNDIHETQKDWTWSFINSKRRKIEDKSKIEEKDSASLKAESAEELLNDSSQAITRHVTVGSVTGELAGMTVPSDPYEFEEDEKDNPSSVTYNPSYTTDINLKVVGLWSHEEMSDLNNKEFSAPETSHLENLLKQEACSPLQKYPDSFTCSDQPVVKLENNTGAKLMAHSLTEKKDLKVSPYDLEHIFNESEDDDIGIPTPPDDHNGDDLQHEEKFQQNNTNSQSTKYDFQTMFPTPPSLESCQAFSPEGKVPSNLSNSLTTIQPVGEKCKNPPHDFLGNETNLMAFENTKNNPHSCVAEEKIVSSGSFGSNYDLHISQSSNIINDCLHFEVFGKRPVSQQPLPNKYLPVNNLPSKMKCDFKENLPPPFMYTPSWQRQMDTFINHQNEIPMMDMEEDMNYIPMSNNPVSSSIGTDVSAPLTPSYSMSVLTPASVPTQSSTPTSKVQRTIGDNLSPASSIATPATIGRMHQRTPLTSVSSSAAQSDTGICRASAIFVNLMLSDSVLNIFRDISFDQCPMCVCNDNISSRDVDLGYLPSYADNLTEGQYPCSCGFSAIRNRTLSVGAGLFLEDELEIVGKELENEIIKQREVEYTPTDENFESVVQYAMKQSSNPYYKENGENISVKYKVENIASKLDIMEACVEAINGGIAVMDIGNQPKIKVHNCKNVLHHWSSSGIFASLNSEDMYRLLQYLKPVLQNAIQRLRSERSFNYIQRVNGPLTWREFCKDNSYALEPLPVPLLLVGQNHDWMTVSPFALNFWERLYLEPYSGTTNISFIALCPDVEHISKAAKFFFQELCSLYEQCRLGMHRPFIRNSKDNGILFVGKNMANASEIPDWFKTFNESSQYSEVSSASKQTDSELLQSVQQYAAACSQVLDSLFNVGEQRPQQKPTGQSLISNKIGSANPVDKQGFSRPPTPLHAQLQINSKIGRDIISQAPFVFKPGTADAGSIVVYFVDPFSAEYRSTISLAIWKCYTGIVKALPSLIQKSIVIQLVPLKDILQFIRLQNGSNVHTIRSLAFSTHILSCRSVSHTQARTMTAFGPASRKKEAIEENAKKIASSSIHSPAFILANLKNMKKELKLEQEQNITEYNILYVVYCLSHDQKWLLASATDQDGEMLETFCVNIEVPPRRVSVHRKQRICIKSAALKKLWNFCLGAITCTASMHWRIVIGRLGRLGHGEIQEWCKHLNRNNLGSLSKQISSECNQCMLNGFGGYPSIISACLTSLEPEGSFTIFPDLVKVAPFGRTATSGTQLQLKTPEDASCTHIYVFPTSSLVQTAGGTFQAENMDFLPDELSFNMPEFAEQDDLTIMEAVNDLFEPSSPQVNPQHSADDITGHAKRSAADRLISTDGANEETSLLQQPLALGYLVSTAPTGPLPDTFWVSCPQARFHCPVFLRFALHVQVSKDEVQNVGNDDLSDEHHKLDSHKTAEVLRYVMENYNALSWLTCDPVSRDRRSCLPVHYSVLARLYNIIRDLT